VHACPSRRLQVDSAQEDLEACRAGAWRRPVRLDGDVDDWGWRRRGQACPGDERHSRGQAGGDRRRGNRDAHDEHDRSGPVIVPVMLCQRAVRRDDRESKREHRGDGHGGAQSPVEHGVQRNKHLASSIGRSRGREVRSRY